MYTEKGPQKGWTGLLYTEIRRYSFFPEEQNSISIIPTKALLNGIINSCLLFKTLLLCLPQLDIKLLITTVQVQVSS